MHIYTKILRDLKSIPRPLKLLTLALCVYNFGWSIISPFISLYFHSLTINYTEVGLLFAVLPLIHVFLSMPLGELTDKIGRKKMILFALLNYLIIGPIYAFLKTFWTLVFVRIYNAFSAMLVWIPHGALVRDYSPKRKEAEVIGYSNTFLNFAAIIGNVVGGLLLFSVVKNIALLFLVLPVTSFATFLLVSGVPETVKSERLSDGIKSVGKVYNLKKLKKELSEKRIAALAFFNTYGAATVGMVLALFARSMGASLLQIGLIYAIYNLPFTIQFVSGDLADRFGRKKMLISGTVLTTLFFLLLFLTTHIYALFVITLFISLGISISSPVIGAYITDLGRGHQGETTGFYTSVSSVASFAAPVFAGVLSDVFSLNAPFLLCSIMFLVATIVAINFED